MGALALVMCLGNQEYTWDRNLNYQVGTVRGVLQSGGETVAIRVATATCDHIKTLFEVLQATIQRGIMNLLAMLTRPVHD